MVAMMAAETRKVGALSLGVLGVVYGDIGTSPLYAFKQCFHGSHGVAFSLQENVIGVLSLVVWSLVVIVCVKYVLLVLRADNHGEGGILALMALALRERSVSARTRGVLTALGVFGAALLYGDGIITPCVTILGAMEGLTVENPAFKDWVVPLTLVVLVAMFAVQRTGTGRVGAVFGPVMLVWFVTLAVLGLRAIAAAPGVLTALLPTPGLWFLVTHGYSGFLVLGAVFLVVTGAEALYADLGHFGAGPIRRAWFVVVLPALLLNYLGQGALLLVHPEAVENPFYLLAPHWAQLPLVVLATAASVIASQALISGAFSLTMQAIQLGYLPRLEIRHTSSDARGQVYLPLVNRVLLVCCVCLVLGFKTSERFASAYGIAVTSTMLITTVLLFIAARTIWRWPLWLAVTVCLVFACSESVFFAANAVKILQGGWFPLLVAVVVYAIMTTWKAGRRLLGARLARSTRPLDTLMQALGRGEALRVPGTAVFMTANPDGTPIALLHNLRHNKVVHERIVLLTFVAAEEPHVQSAHRLRIEPLQLGFTRVVASFGFMETPHLGEVERACALHGRSDLLANATFFLSRETVMAKGSSLRRLRGNLFAFLSRNAQSPTAFFGLPVERVVEVGLQIEI
jgi:KUP system potassium uptake protein